jgi:CheY-like chemotaxis protein
MSASEQPSLRTSGLRVLLVEDEIMVALLLEDMLAELGHKVVGPVARLKQALEMAQQEPLDVAILDVNINGNEVYPVAEALAARDIPFAFVTGYGGKGLRALYCDRPTLQKPFRRRELRELFADLCRASRPEHPTGIAPHVRSAC